MKTGYFLTWKHKESKLHSSNNVTQTQLFKNLTLIGHKSEKGFVIYHTMNMRPFHPIVGICTVTNAVSRFITHNLGNKSQSGTLVFMTQCCSSCSSFLLFCSQFHRP